MAAAPPRAGSSLRDSAGKPRAPAAARRRFALTTRSLGIAGLAGLTLAAVPLAAPGPGLVGTAGVAGQSPMAGEGAPGWLLGVFGDGLAAGPGLYYGFLWLAFVSYLCVFLAAPALGRRPLRGAASLMVALFALAPPLLSQDVFSYIDYARMGALHDLNPYLHAPIDFPADPAFRYVGWVESPSAYGPLFTLATYPLAAASVPVALWALKAVAAASVLGLAVLVARIAPGRGVDPGRGLVLVALNPLVLVHVVGGAHNDAIAMLLAIAGCAALLALREASAGAALVSAAALKISSAFVLPFAVLAAARGPVRRKAGDISSFRPTDAVGGGWAGGMARFLAGAAAALAGIGLAAWLAFGWHWLDAFAVAGENQGRVSNYSLPNLLSELLGVSVGPIRAAALGLYLALVAALGAWVWRGADWVRAAGWAALGLLLASAWLLPWYVIWALPFAALSRDGRLIAAVLALTALQLAARVPL